VEYARGSLYATSSPELEDLFAGLPPAAESTLVKYRLGHRHPSSGHTHHKHRR